jgi:hypothetical protein
MASDSTEPNQVGGISGQNSESAVPPSSDQTLVVPARRATSHNVTPSLQVPNLPMQVPTQYGPQILPQKDRMPIWSVVLLSYLCGLLTALIFATLVRVFLDKPSDQPPVSAAIVAPTQHPSATTAVANKIVSPIPAVSDTATPAHVLNTPTSLVITSDKEPIYIKQLTAYKEGYQGLYVYFVLADTNGAMMAATGTARLQITEGEGSDLRVLYDKPYAIEKFQFVTSTVGQGSFAHELLLCSFGRIAYSEFSALPSRYSGSLKLTFTTASGKELIGQESFTFDLEPTPIPSPENTSTPVVFTEGTHIPVATVEGQPTSTTPLFEVSEPVSRLSYGYRYFVGVLKYNGDTIREEPSIILTLTDEQGNLLSSQKASTVPSFLRPHSLVPYVALISDPPEKWAKLSIEVTADEPSEFMRGYYYTDVTLEGINTKPSGSGIKSVGRVKNTGTKTLSSAKIIAAIYNDKDQLVDVVSTYMIQDSVAPGASGTFELTSSQTKSAKRIEFVVTGSP